MVGPVGYLSNWDNDGDTGTGIEDVGCQPGNHSRKHKTVSVNKI